MLQRRNIGRSWMIAMVPAAVLVSVLLGGCAEFQPIGPPRLAPRQALNVHDLARRLSLDVSRSTNVSAMLRRQGDSVLIFPDPGGAVYVNGKNLGDPGPIVAIEQVLHVPGTLEGRIRAALPASRVATPGRRPPKPNGQKRPPWQPLPATTLRGRVVIDAGHGGNQPGTDAAVKNFGIRLYEKEANLAVARIVAQRLGDRGAQIVMTRRNDRRVSLDSRVAVANRGLTRLFVSIHADYSPNPSDRRFLVLVAKGASASSRRAAGLIHRYMSQLGRYGHIRTDSRGLRVLKNTTCPAVLVETGCLSNRRDAKMLADPVWQRRIAGAIADAVAEYLSR